MDLKKLIKDVINEKLVTGSPAAPVKEPGVKPPPVKPSPRPRPSEPSIIPRPGPATKPKATKSEKAFYNNRKRHKK